MSTRQIKLSAKPPAGNDITTTISNVNPNADGETMRNFAKMLNRFTNNTYQKSDLVETTNLDTESVKRFANIEIADNGVLVRGADPSINTSYLYTPVTIDGQRINMSMIGFTVTSPENAYIYKVQQSSTSGHATELETRYPSGSTLPTSNAKLKITAILFETETYYTTVATKTITVTVAE